jgi:hypothetical protein
LQTLSEMTNRCRRDWCNAVQLLRDSDKRQKDIAAQHGCSIKAINWALDNGILGLTRVSREYRETFLVQQPSAKTAESATALIEVGYCARLCAGSQGNRRQSVDQWRYTPATIDPWPLVVGNLGTVETLICVGGEWGVLSIIDLMEWWHEFPPRTVVVGLRGPKSWRLFGRDYRWKAEPLLFAFANDYDITMGWLRKDRALMTVNLRFKRMALFNVDIPELWRQRGITPDVFSRTITPAQPAPALQPSPGVTFLRFCYAQRDREDDVGAAARFLIRDKNNRPRGRPPRLVWERYIVNHVPEQRRTGLRDAWAEWQNA